MTEQGTAFDFDVFKPVIVSVTLNLGYRTVTLKLGVLSYWRWDEIGADVPDPQPPMRLLENGRSEPNYGDARYLMLRSRAEAERSLRRVAEALEAGGARLPGANLAQKAEHLRDWETGVVSGLTQFLMQAAFPSKDRISAKADSFLGAGSGDVADAGTDGLDAGSMARAAGAGQSDGAGMDFTPPASD